MTPFIGLIVMFGGNFAPRGWAFCDGQLLPISQNQSLFSILGTTYGGDGRTTFALPDLRGRVATHAGQGPGLSSYRLGQRGGAENINLSINEMPAHNHTITGDVTIGIGAGSADSNKAKDTLLANKADANIYNTAAPGNSLGGVSNDFAVQNTGGGLAHENRQPYLTVNYIIALQGVYPSRN